MKKYFVLIACSTFFISFGQKKNIKIQSDARVDQLVDRKVEINKQGIHVDGFVIQIFNGRNQQAQEAARAFLGVFPNYPAVTEYDNPDYKVFVGAFRTQADANEALNRIKQHPAYSGAFVRPKQIVIFD